MVKKGLILITRPKEQAKTLAVQLENKGYKTLIASLLEIRINDHINPSLITDKKLQAVLITSGNAIPALSKLNLPKNILIISVGKMTGAKIKETEYKNVVCANNSAADLQKLAMQILKPENGLVIYLSGEKVTLDLAVKLSLEGYKTVRINVYEAKERNSLAKNIIEKIRSHTINEVFIYSYNSALIFHRLILKHNLLECCNHIKLLCLSKKIADYFIKSGFKKVGIKNNYDR